MLHLTREKVFPPLLLLVAFFLIPFAQLDHLRMMPGDIGDARLVNYFLEHLHLCWIGVRESVWHPGFFSPFPFVLGFSDNMFGMFPIYEIARNLTSETDTAFQLWFLAAYPINFLACHFALRKLGCSSVGAAIGALVFSFSLPVTTHIGHPQLIFRFGLPLSISYFIVFLQHRNWWHFLFAAFWLIWQYYCSIYIGFFTSLILLLIFFAAAVYFFRLKSTQPDFAPAGFIQRWLNQTRLSQAAIILGLLALTLAVLWLFYPYIKVSELYGAKRSTAEIMTMLPRLQSYFTADSSLLWGGLSAYYPKVPMSNEHQMFAGALPWLLTGFAIISRKVERDPVIYSFMLAALGGTILLTLNVYGFSFWTPFTKLPMVSSIRAVTRLDLALLFPLAYFSALSIQYFSKLTAPAYYTLLTLILALLLGEMAATTPYVSSKADWRSRLAVNAPVMPKNLPPDAIVFFAQNRGPAYAAEIDSMWHALNHRVNTLNGYSGFSPPEFSGNFRKNCSELPRRVLSYLSFSQQDNDPAAYQQLMSQIVTIGFSECQASWATTAPALTVSAHTYTPEQIQALRLEYLGKSREDGVWTVSVRLHNASDLALPARSSVEKPFHLIWRFVDATGKPTSRWMVKKVLPYDLPGKSSMPLDLPVDPRMEIAHGTMQIFMGQTAIADLPPLSIPWNHIATSP